MFLAHASCPRHHDLRGIEQPFVDPLESDMESHQLGETRRRNWIIGVVLKENDARACLEEYYGASGKRRRGRQGSEEKHMQRNRGPRKACREKEKNQKKKGPLCSIEHAYRYLTGVVFGKRGRHFSLFVISR